MKKAGQTVSKAIDGYRRRIDDVEAAEDSRSEMFRKRFLRSNLLNA